MDNYINFPKEPTNIEAKKALITFNEKVNSFQNSSKKKYVFYTNIEDLKKDDVVIVQSGNSLTLGVFVSYTDSEKYTPHKWIISKAELSLYNSIKEKEIKRNKIREEIRKRLSIFNDVSKLELLCAFDKELNDMVDEFHKLNGTTEKTHIAEKIDQIILNSTFIQPNEI